MFLCPKTSGEEPIVHFALKKFLCPKKKDLCSYVQDIKQGSNYALWIMHYALKKVLVSEIELNRDKNIFY